LISRARIDAAIERWLRALELAGAMRSTSALLAQAAQLGCQVHGTRRAQSCPLTGLAAAERAVALCTGMERRALALKYGGVELRHELAADGSTVVGVIAFRASDAAVARRLRVGQRRLAGILRSARRKVAVALDG